MTAKAWVVRGGRNGEYEQHNVQTGRTTVGWVEAGDIGPCQSREDILALLEQVYPDYQPMRRSNIAGQLWAFRDRIKVGDLIVMPLKTQPGHLRFGRVTGPYTFDAQNPDPKLRKYLAVEWGADTVHKAGIASDLMLSLNSLMTVFSPSRNDAVNRLEAIAATGLDPRLEGGDTETSGGPEEPAAGGDDDVTDPPPAPTLESIEDRVRSHVMSEFKEHDLTWLVAEILEAHEFVCQVSPPGPDGGVDILAGKGPLGMDAPIVVVEVKSQPGPVDTKVVRGLNSARQWNNADQALLVAWGGVNGPARQQIRTDSKFRVWDGDTLMTELFHVYDELSPETKRRIPLQRAWVLDEDALV